MATYTKTTLCGTVCYVIPCSDYESLLTERDALSAQLRAAGEQVPVGCMSQEQFDAMMAGPVENGDCFRIWQMDNPPNRAKSGVKLYAAPVPPSQEDRADRVADICNAYESGVGHRGRPTAHVNPYPCGSDESMAYALGAIKEHHGMLPPSQEARDAERLDFLVAEGAVIRSLMVPPPYGSGVTRYYIGWPELGEEQEEMYEDPRAAIDAAFIAAKEKGK